METLTPVNRGGETVNRIEDAELLRLKDQEGLSFRELGGLCGVSHVAVRKRYLRLKGVNSGANSVELPPEAGAGILAKVSIENEC